MEKFRKDLLQNAKNFYERFVREQLDAPEARHQLGLAHYRLAKIQQVLGDYAMAQALSEKAIEILGELARTHPEAVEYQRDLAAGQFELGTVYSDTGGVEKAEAAYKQALAIQEKLANDHPEVAEYRRALATTQDGLGYLNFRADRFERAQASLEQALATWNQLIGDGSQVPEDRHGLANVQERLGRTYGYRGQSEKAEATLKGAVDTCQALVHDHPDAPEYRHSLARNYNELGDFYYNMHQPEKAEAPYQQALRIFEKLAQEHPDVLEFTYDVGYCHSCLAFNARDLGRLDAALASFDKATEILERVVSRGYRKARNQLFDVRISRAFVLAERGEHVQAADEASAIAHQERLNATNLYNVACAFSVASAAVEKDTKLSPADQAKLKVQYADRAMEFLHQAVEKGWQNAPSIKSDPDLASLRAREDFQKLVKEIEQKSKSSGDVRGQRESRITHPIQGKISMPKGHGLNVYVMDARELTFQEEFDAVFSNAVLHWVNEPDLAVAAIARALKPGGRFVAEFGGKGNIKTIEDALIQVVSFFGVNGRALSPWYYPAPDEYQAVLEKYGLQVQSIALIPRPTPLPEGMAGWLKTFAGPFLQPFPSILHPYLLWRARMRMKPLLCDKDGNWHADYVRLRVLAKKC
jgi:tetratricopeptide (TPR) repeat protein